MKHRAQQMQPPLVSSHAGNTGTNASLPEIIIIDLFKMSWLTEHECFSYLNFQTVPLASSLGFGFGITETSR